MEHTERLSTLLSDLEKLTGIRMDIQVQDQDELDLAIEQVQRLYNAYKEKYSKEYFLKRLLHWNQSVQELEKQAHHFRMEPCESRIGFLLETKVTVNQTILTILKHLIPTRTSDYIVPVSDNRVLILMAISEKTYKEADIRENAYTFIEALNAEALTDGKIACGPVIHHLSELAEAFQKMSLTLKIGQIFDSAQSVFFYNHLGISRLIHELPVSVCHDYLDEIFHNGIPHFDSEITSVTNCFFENNLNIAETARQLHMHRNTLIYRLDQVEQMTGLNLKNFEDAMLFKIALMILQRSNLDE